MRTRASRISIFFSILLIGSYRNYIPAIIQTHLTGLSAELQNNWNMGNYFLIVCTAVLIDQTGLGAGSVEISAGSTQQASSVRYWTSPTHPVLASPQSFMEV